VAGAVLLAANLLVRLPVGLLTVARAVRGDIALGAPLQRYLRGGLFALFARGHGSGGVGRVATAEARAGYDAVLGVEVAGSRSLGELGMEGKGALFDMGLRFFLKGVGIGIGPALGSTDAARMEMQANGHECIRPVMPAPSQARLILTV